MVRGIAMWCLRRNRSSAARSRLPISRSIQPTFARALEAPDEQHEREQALLVHRRAEQGERGLQRRVSELAGYAAHVWDADTEEAVTRAVLAAPALEESRRASGDRRVRERA